MPCEDNPEHENYCDACSTCFDCMFEDDEATINIYKSVLRKIVDAHKMSTVDLVAMKQAEMLIK